MRGILPGRVRLRPGKYLNNVVEQDHRTVKKRAWLAKATPPSPRRGGRCKESKRCRFGRAPLRAHPFGISHFVKGQTPNWHRAISIKKRKSTSLRNESE